MTVRNPAGSADVASRRGSSRLARRRPNRPADRLDKRLGFLARTSGRMDEAHPVQGQFRQAFGAPQHLEARTDQRSGQDRRRQPRAQQGADRAEVLRIEPRPASRRAPRPAPARSHAASNRSGCRARAGSAFLPRPETARRRPRPSGSSRSNSRPLSPSKSVIRARSSAPAATCGASSVDASQTTDTSTSG